MATLNDWIKKYESKTKEKFEPKQGFELVYFPEHGFAEICVKENSIFVWQLCGDARWWFNALTAVVRQMRLKYITSLIIRKVRPFIRIFGYKIDDVITANNGTQRFNCSSKDGGKMTASTSLNPDGTYAFATISWEVN